MENTLKKYWYRITDKKKYQIYRNKINKEKELKSFKENLEKYINDVQKKLDLKKL